MVELSNFNSNSKPQNLEFEVWSLRFECQSQKLIEVLDLDPAHARCVGRLQEIASRSSRR